MGLALGAALFFGTPSAKAQGVPRGFTYQGLLAEGTTPFTGSVSLVITITDQSQVTQLYQETLQNVTVTDGIFNVIVGGTGSTAFPLSMDFNQQYFMQVTVNGTSSLAPVELWSAPYALNAGTVNGISADTIPIKGELFPVPIGTGYNGSVKIDPAFLPSIPNNFLQTPDILTINGIGPDKNGNFQINQGAGIVITPGQNEITISTGSGGSGVTNVFPGSGMNINATGPNGTGAVTVGIAPGGISGSMLPPGVVTGQKISGIAGAGLLQDGAGLLDVNVDNITIGITSLQNGNLLEVLPGGIGTLQLANGAVTNAKIATPYIGFTSTGNTLLPSDSFHCSDHAAWQHGELRS